MKSHYANNCKNDDKSAKFVIWLTIINKGISNDNNSIRTITGDGGNSNNNDDANYYTLNSNNDGRWW